MTVELAESSGLLVAAAVERVALADTCQDSVMAAVTLCDGVLDADRGTECLGVPLAVRDIDSLGLDDPEPLSDADTEGDALVNGVVVCTGPHACVGVEDAVTDGVQLADCEGDSEAITPVQAVSSPSVVNVYSTPSPTTGANSALSESTVCIHSKSPVSG